MGGSQSGGQSSNQFAMQGQLQTPTGLEPYTQQFGQGYSSLSNLYGNRIAQPLNLQQYSANITDPSVKNFISQGIQDIKNQQTAGQRGLSQTLGGIGNGNNTALLAALNRQSQIGQAGAINALYPQAFNQQLGLTQARNTETLGARSQLINELTPGMNLLQTLIGMAQTAKGTKNLQMEQQAGVGESKQSKSFF